MSFPKMTSVIPECERGVAKVVHMEVTREDSLISIMRRDYCSPGRYAVLKINGQTVMSDTDMERESNRDFARRANGKVLVAGLGLGMILHPLLGRESVSSILVIEKELDVIDLVLPTVKHSKLRVFHADIHDWKPGREKWDTIYFDIWPNRCTDNLAQMSTLHRRFARRLNRDNPRCWMGSWYQDELRYMRRRDL